MFRRVYLDNSATTPIDPAVLEAMMPYLTEKFGNASSIHHFGQETRSAVDKARHQVAALINARPNEIIFTSGGTESNNLAIRGLAQSVRNSPPFKGGVADAGFPTADGVVVPGHIITSAIEHPAVRNVCEDLEKQGVRITYLPVYENGIVRVEDVETAVADDTLLISIMMANNEIGTIQPVAEIGKLVRRLRETGRKIWFHTDAVQAVGKMAVDVEELGCDLLSMSAHKIYAPKGIGALYVRRGVRLHAQNLGGRQERGLRGGTEPVAQIVAMGKACELSEARPSGRTPTPGESNDLEPMLTRGLAISTLRDRLEDAVAEMVPDVVFNGDRENRLPNISNISFLGVEGEGLLINLDMQGIAVSTGSACSSGSLEPSPIIRALELPPPSLITHPSVEDRARSAIRFSLGRFTTGEDIDRLLEVLPAAVENLRKLAPGA